MSAPGGHRPPDPDDETEAAPTPLWKRRGVLIAAGLAVVVLVFIFTRHGTPTAPIAVAQDGTISVTQPYEGPPPIRPPAPAPPPPSQPLAPPPPLGPPLLNNHDNSHPATRPAAISYPVHIEPPKQASVPAAPDQTGLKFATSQIPGLKASPAIDDTYMLMPGLLLVVLDSAIDSNLPGPILAHLPGPVYSPKGTLLMEAMSQVIGKYESMKQNGVERLEAVSTYAHTPNGIWVPLAGQPLVDSIGRAGLSGTIDKRLLERFGGAVLLDLAQTGLQIIQSKVSKGGDTYLNFNGSDQLATQILQSSINLPPLFTKNQGSMIAIWLTEPIDFSDSYRVVAK